jgi:hypothetical protein
MPQILTYLPFSGVGIVTVYERDSAGVRGKGYDMGEVNPLSVTIEAPRSEMKTSRTADRGTAFSMAQSRAGRLSMTCKTLTDFSRTLLNVGTFSDAVAGAALVNVPLPTGLAVGNVAKIPGENLTAVSVTDSTGTPKTLAASQYELDPVAGTLRFLDVTTGGPYVQPFKVSATPGTLSVISGLQAQDKEWFVVLSMVNAHNGDKSMFEAYRWRFSPDGEQGLISDDYGQWVLSGTMERDDTKLASAVGGQYYRIVRAQ